MVKKCSSYSSTYPILDIIYPYSLFSKAKIPSWFIFIFKKLFLLMCFSVLIKMKRLNTGPIIYSQPVYQEAELMIHSSRKWLSPLCILAACCLNNLLSCFCMLPVFLHLHSFPQGGNVLKGLLSWGLAQSRHSENIGCENQ